MKTPRGIRRKIKEKGSRKGGLQNEGEGARHDSQDLRREPDPSPRPFPGQGYFLQLLEGAVMSWSSVLVLRTWH